MVGQLATGFWETGSRLHMTMGIMIWVNEYATSEESLDEKEGITRRDTVAGVVAVPVWIASS